jgi:predicted GIY-YIG superfamily endonuclease/uncharacterized protein YdeI (YjbR/CyaY-like superfamily)
VPFVYIVECGDGSLYTGATTDVEARLQAHNHGAGARYTRTRRPVRLVYVEAVEDWAAALRREMRIKRMNRAAKLALAAKAPPAGAWHARMEPTYFDSAAAFRTWLDENHDSATEIVVGFYKTGADKSGITYAEALDEALCYGWIDGVRKRVDDERYQIRFSPRKRGSIWSEVNIARAEALTASGRMQAAGEAAFAARDESKTKQSSYEERSRPLDETYAAPFKENVRAWEFFEAQPPSYRRAASWWVMSAKREETRQRRLTKLVGHSERGERLPEVLSPNRRRRTKKNGAGA